MESEKNSVIETPNFWQQRYTETTPAWDIGIPAPAFVSLLNSPQKPVTGRAAVLGCGRGYDALLFASHDFSVVGFDFAPTAIAGAQELATQQNIKAEFLERDIFNLEADFSGSFDYVIEHTCFCAIPPTKRYDYVQLVKKLLRPGGELIAIFFTHNRAGGPPFGVQVEEIKDYFQDLELICLQPVDNSIPRRLGEEYFGRFRYS